MAISSDCKKVAIVLKKATYIFRVDEELNDFEKDVMTDFKQIDKSMLFDGNFRYAVTQK